MERINKEIEYLRDSLEGNPDRDDTGWEYDDPARRRHHMELLYSAERAIRDLMEDVQRLDVIDRKAFYDEDGETGWNVPRVSGGDLRNAVDTQLHD